MSGSKGYLIDSNVFLRFFVPEDAVAHADSKELIRCIATRKLEVFTSPIVFSEVAWVLGRLYQFEKKEIVRALDSMTGLAGLEIDRSCSLELATQLFERHSVKYADAQLAATDTILKGGTMISYDKDFDKLRVKRLEPRKVLKELRH